jgi:hypothetical protein
MPDVVKHAWTHRPKSQGGTDPIAGGFTPEWAHAYASAMDVPDAGATYDFTFSDLYSNSASIYEAVDITASRAEYIAIHEAGYYQAAFGIYHNTSTFGTGSVSFIQPSFELGGIRASIINNLGEADHAGTKFNLSSYILAGGPAREALWYFLTFHYDPDNPVSDMDSENPVKVGVSYALAGGAATIQMSASMFLLRIAEAGYNDLSPA